MRTILSLCLALAATLAMFQLAAQQSNTKDKQKQDKQVSDDDTPLYSKPVGAKGNTKATKESSTLAFSGIDPTTGKPTQSRMGESASSSDAEQVKKMFDRVPKRDVLMAFVKEGGLIAR